MSKCNYKLIIKYKDRSWNKTLRGDDWEKHYNDITKFVKKRTKKQIGTECYASVENTTVSSKDVFESLVTNSDQSGVIKLFVHDGLPPANDASDDDNKDTSQAKCVIIYQKKIVKFYLATDEGQIESTESFQDFCDFLEDEVGLPNIDIDDMNNVNDSIEIFAIKNKDDIDNDSTQIESHEDFGDVFENFNPHSDPRQTTPSADDDCKENKNQAKGITLKINLHDMDCKTNQVTINNVDHGSWEKILKSVGEACEDSQWTSKYSLCTTNNTNEIRTFVETSQDLTQFLRKNGGKAAVLSAKGVTALKDKTFLVEYNGKTVLWQPAAQFARNKARVWSKFLYVLKRGLGSVDFNVVNIYYSKKKNTLAMNTNELNGESIEQFWNKLKDDKRAALMYFEICENAIEMDNDEKVEDNYKGLNVKREYYFVVKHDNKTLDWSPNTLTNIDWSQQYDKLKNDVCCYFRLQVSAQIGFTFDGMEVNDTEDIENIWEEEVESSNTKCVELKVVNVIKASGVDTNNRQHENVVMPGKSIDENEKFASSLVGGGAKAKMILHELCMVDKNLMNATVTKQIESDLEFLYDDIRKRQRLIESSRSLAPSEIEGASLEPGKDVTSAVLNRFEKLINLMKTEHFSDTNTTMIAVCKARDGIRKKDWNAGCRELKTSMDEIRPFNIKEMLKLHGKTDEAAKQVIGQDIVLLLGHTGAGKSTTIHFLGGSTMKRDPNTGHIEPVYIPNECLRKVRTEFKVAQSVTRYISAVPMKLSDAGIRLLGQNAKDLILLCDTPGFDDSAGPEVDVANGLGIVKGVSQANSVKIILVIGSSDFGMRMKGIKNLTHTLSKIMPNFDEYFGCITPIYTKMNKTAKEIENILSQAMIDMKNEGEDNDEAFNRMLEFLSQMEKPIILNPIKSKRQKVLKQIFGQQHRKWVSEPSEQFEPFVTEGSRNLMKQQILKHTANIVKAVKYSNYTIIQRKLSELVELNAVIPDKTTQASIIECMKQVSKNWNEKCNEAIETLTESTKSRSREEFGRDISKYQTLLDEAKECQMFQEMFRSVPFRSVPFSSVPFGDGNVEGENTELENEDLVSDMIDATQLNHHLNEMFKFLLNECSLEPHTKIYFDKAQAVCDRFGEFEDFNTRYHDRMNVLYDEVMQIKQHVEKCIANHRDYDNIYANLNKLGRLRQLQEEFTFGSNAFDILQVSTSLKKQLMESLQTLKKIVEISFEYTKESQEFVVKPDSSVKKYKEVVESLTKCSKVFNIPCIGIEKEFGTEIAKLYENFRNSIVKYFEKSLSYFSSFLKKQMEENVASNKTTVSSTNKDVKSFMKQLFSMLEMNDDIKMQTLGFYYQAIQNIIGNLHNIRRIFAETVEQIEKNQENIDYSKLVLCVNVLRKYSWIFGLRDGDASVLEKEDIGGNNEILNAIEETLIKHCRKLFDQADNLFVDLNNPDSLLEAKKLLDSLSGLKELQQLLPNISTALNQVGSRLQMDVRIVLRTIQQEFAFPTQPKKQVNENESKQQATQESRFARLNGKRASNSINFINKCKKINWFTPIWVTVNLVQEPNEKAEWKADKDSDDMSDVEKNMEKEMKEISMRQEIEKSLDKFLCYMAEYGKHRMDDMETCMDYLIDLAHDNAGIQANTKAVALSNGLKELETIETKYSNLMGYLSEEKLLTEWQMRLEEAHGIMEASLGALKSGQNPKLQIGVKHVKALGKVDWFLKNYCNLENGSCFQPLWLKYQAVIDPTPKTAELRQLTSGEDFLQVQSVMERLKSSIEVAEKLNDNNLVALKRSFSNAQTELGYQLTDKAESLRSSVINLKNMHNSDKLDTTSLVALQKQLNSITEAKNCCSNFLLPTDMNRIGSLEKVSKELIISFAKTIADHAKPAIENYKFGIGEKDLNQIQQIMDVLGSALSKTDGKNEDTRKTLSDTHTMVREMISTRLQKIEKDFIEEIKLEDAIHNPYIGHRSPRALYSNLQPVMQQHQEYNRIWDKIEKDLYKKFRNEFKRSESLLHYKCMKLERVLNQAVLSLPDEMQKQLGGELEHWKVDTEQRKELEPLIAFIDTDDYDGLNDAYWQYQNVQNTTKANQVKDKIRTKLQQICQHVTNIVSQSKIDSHDFDDVCEALKTGYKIVNQFGPDPNSNKSNKILEFDKLFLVMVKGVVDKYNSRIDEIEALLSKEEYSKQIVNSFNNAFMFVTSIEKLQQSSIDTIGSTTVLKEAVTIGKKKYVEVVQKYFDELYTKYNRSFNALDMISMKRVLDCMNLFDSDGIKRIAVNINLKMSYSAMIGKIDAKMNQVMQDLMNVEFDNSDKLPTQKEKKIFYKQVRDQISVLKNCKKIENHLKIDTTQEYVDKVTAAIDDRINDVCSATMAHVVNGELPMDSNVLRSINSNYSNLMVIFASNIIDSKKTNLILKNTCDKIKKNIIAFIEQKGKEAQNVCNDAKQLAPYLSELQLMKTVLIEFSEYASKIIEECLKQYKKQGSIVALMTMLETNDTVEGGWGNVIVSEHYMFKGEAGGRFSKLMTSVDIKEVLHDLKGNDFGYRSNNNSVDKAKIENCFQRFNSTYERLMKQNLIPNLDFSGLVFEATKIALKCKQVMVARQGKWSDGFKKSAVELMAYIFAIWTLKNSDYFFDVGGRDDDKKYLMQPHAAQVVSIIRLLGIDTKEEKIVNNLVEIGTGEGKSLTLAVASCILAMIGFDVSCACYSQYLSDRDYESFKNLFEELKIDKYIHYGTFNQICENVINDGGNIRGLTKKIILQNEEKNNVEKKENSNKPNTGRKKILLIDEVDVFFSKEFYGNIYKPTVMIGDDNIKEITDLIWRDHELHRTTQDWKLNLNKIKKQGAYKALTQKFGKWTKLLDEAIKRMLVDVRKFDKTEYVIKDCQIGYKDGDQISTTLKKGYKTLFTYYKEKARVSPQSFEDNIGITIKCGNFSYAEIASEKNFQSIFGVTGTLKHLSKKEKEIMKANYGIKRYTYIPSLFGDRSNRFKFSKKGDVNLYNDKDYFRELTRCIQQKLNENGKDRQRCVFVCFESNKRMNEYAKCIEFSAYKTNSLILNEEANFQEKSSIVKQATIPGKITLFTRIFGRGTDFQVTDDKVKNNGGPHVIQTFLSKQLSEEVQIQGRTARQGGVGSYSMVLRKSELEQFGITQAAIKSEQEKKDPEMYELMNEMRLKKFEKEWDQTGQNVKKAAHMHKTALRLVDALRTNCATKARELLIDLNKCKM